MTADWPVAEADCLAAYRLVWDWLDSPRLDHPTAVLLSELLDRLGAVYEGITGRKVGQDWAP